MENVIFLALLAAIVAALVWFRSWRSRQTLADKLSKRPSLEFEDFYKKFYDGKLNRETVRPLLNKVADEFKVPADKLLPTDRFDVELKQPVGHEFDTGLDLLPMQVELLARSKGGMVKAESITTVDDYITQMARFGGVKDTFGS